MSADVVAVHEAGHAVIGALIRGAGVRVVAAMAGDRAPRVSTLHCRGSTAAEAMAAEAGFALVALAGPAAELMCAREAARVDEANAGAAALRIVRLRHGGAEISAAMRAEAAELVERLRGQATELVHQSWPLIERVAGALAEGPLTGAQIDALINLETGKEIP